MLNAQNKLYQPHRDPKIKVLLSAFACRPDAGSEWGVGWNFFIRLSKIHDVHLITEIEYKSDILEECKRLNLSDEKIHFVDIGTIGRRKAHNQGDWTFYYFYHKWQKNVLLVAQEIHNIIDFDVVHHLNMIGFREPGLLHKLNIPFVLGPLGGFGGIPESFYASKFSQKYLQNKIKQILNSVSLSLPYVKSAIQNASRVIAAYPEAAADLERHFKIKAIVIPETGSQKIACNNTDRENFVWIGKNLDRKQFKLAAEAFLMSSMSIKENLIVVGEFEGAEIVKWAKFKNIIFMGSVPRNEVLSQLSRARALIFTSLHEGNPHVVYESLSSCTPVICHDSYGMGMSINESVGIKIKVKNFQSSLRDFSNAIDGISKMHFKLEDFEFAQKHNNWNSRVHEMSNVYQEVLQDQVVNTK